MSLEASSREQYQQILGIRFFTGSPERAAEIGLRGGLVVVPAAPALVITGARRILAAGGLGTIGHRISQRTATLVGLATIVGSIGGICLVRSPARAKTAKHDVGVSRSSGQGLASDEGG